MWVTRRHEKRTLRIRIYYELLRPLLDYTGRKGFVGATKAQLDPPEFRELLDPVVRTARAIGGRDATKAEVVLGLLITWSELTDGAIYDRDQRTGEKTLEFVDRGTEEEIAAAHSSFLDALEAYDIWLASRL